jgi:sugar transferase (PEP-CTERM/EpsH1 system associated)
MVPYLRVGALLDVPAVVDLVDVDSQKWFDYGVAHRGPKSWLYHLEGRRLRRLEYGLPDWARAVTLVSEDEAILFRRRVRPADLVHAVTNGVDTDYFRPQPGVQERGCIFVGALDYAPNVDGIVWFCREAWPDIRRRHPGATLSLVGRRPAPAVRRLAGLPGVKLVGQVPDVRPWLAGAAVAVAPLRIARGIQNKVLEAMAMGKAVVASPHALSGLGVEPGTHALAATDGNQWADAVGALLDDDSLRRRLGAAGLCYVWDRHCWDACLGQFGTILDQISGRDKIETTCPLPAPSSAVVSVSERA